MNAEPALACPRCDRALLVGHAGGMVLRACGTCGGVWLASACAARLAEKLPAEAIALAGNASRHASAAHDAARPAPCPVCRTVMSRTRVQAAGLDIDACGRHGTWYDKSELERIAETLARLRAPAPRPASVASTPRAKADSDSGTSAGDIAIGAAYVGFSVLSIFFD